MIELTERISGEMPKLAELIDAFEVGYDDYDDLDLLGIIREILEWKNVTPEYIQKLKAEVEKLAQLQAEFIEALARKATVEPIADADAALAWFRDRIDDIESLARELSPHFRPSGANPSEP